MSSPLRKRGIDGTREASKQLGMPLDSVLHEGATATPFDLAAAALDVWRDNLDEIDPLGPIEPLEPFAMRLVQMLVAVTGRTDGEAINECVKKLCDLYTTYGDPHDS